MPLLKNDDEPFSREAGDNWVELCDVDPCLIQANGFGAMTRFAEATSRARSVRVMMFYSLQRSFRKFLCFEEEDDVTETYLDKCEQLAVNWGGREEKVDESCPPLGAVLPNPDGETYGTGIPDESPLITLHTHETRTAAIHSLQLAHKGVRTSYTNNPPPETEEDKVTDEELHELGPTRDRLEFATRKLWKLRLKQENDDITRSRFTIVSISLLEFILSIVVFGLGAVQLDGGRISVVIASSVTGSMGVISCFLGLFGALPKNPSEAVISFYYSVQVWLIALLTTFIFVELDFILDNEDRCRPSATYAGEDDCSNRGELVVTLILAFCLLMASFTGCHASTVCLDTVNDATSLLDKFLIFTYKLNLLRELQAPLLNSGKWDHTLRQDVKADIEPMQPAE